MLWVPEPHGCPCPQCPPHRASLGAHLCVCVPAQGQDRLTHVPTHSWMPTPPSPPDPPIHTPPSSCCFPCLSFPSSASLFPGHATLKDIAMAGVPMSWLCSTTCGPRPALTPPHPSWGCRGVGTHTPYPALPCLSFPTPYALWPPRTASRDCTQLMTQLTHSALPIFDQTQPDPL